MLKLKTVWGESVFLSQTGGSSIWTEEALLYVPGKKACPTLHPSAAAFMASLGEMKACFLSSWSTGFPAGRGLRGGSWLRSRWGEASHLGGWEEELSSPGRISSPKQKLPFLTSHLECQALPGEFTACHGPAAISCRTALCPPPRLANPLLDCLEGVLLALAPLS